MCFCFTYYFESIKPVGTNNKLCHFILILAIISQFRRLQSLYGRHFNALLCLFKKKIQMSTWNSSLEKVLQKQTKSCFPKVDILRRGRGKYHCTVDLLFDWFGINSMTTDNFCFYLQNRLIQTSQTGGQW
jgi:hypothetical protein